jgi:hypothetical protein
MEQKMRSARAVVADIGGNPTIANTRAPASRNSLARASTLLARTNRQLSAVFCQRFGDGLANLSVAAYARYDGHFAFKADLHVIQSGAYLI